jgi:hypothetical protein
VSELTFSVLGIAPDRSAATPTLVARLRISELTGATVHAVALRCQVRIEPQRRLHGPLVAEELSDVFGPRHLWASTLRPFLWLHASTMVPGFSGATEVDLPLPCTYDLEVAAGKYLHAVRDGDIPLSLMFSGTVFTRGTTATGTTDFSVEQVRWDADVEHHMPAAVWRQLLDLHFPGAGWIRLDTGTIDELRAYRARRGCTSWDETFALLLGTQRQLAADGAETGGRLP